MSKEKIKEKLFLDSKKDTSWKEKAKYRAANKAWLDKSFSIALAVISKISENKESNQGISTQVMLAEELGCSAQYVNKILKGTENLTLETISKIEEALGINLIKVSNFSEPAFSEIELQEENNQGFTRVYTLDCLAVYDKIGDKLELSASGKSKSYSQAMAEHAVYDTLELEPQAA